MIIDILDRRYSILDINDLSCEGLMLEVSCMHVLVGNGRAIHSTPSFKGVGDGHCLVVISLL